jgi:hypothetical protein
MTWKLDEKLLEEMRREAAKDAAISRLQKRLEPFHLCIVTAEEFYPEEHKAAGWHIIDATIKPVQQSYDAFGCEAASIEELEQMVAQLEAGG